MRQLKQNVLAVGAIDWDRRMFDELIPLPGGTSYNAYLIRGSRKTALLDTVDPTKLEVLLDNLVKAGVRTIDYIVSHHGEQDHSGSIEQVQMLYPDSKVVTNAKCKEMLVEHLRLADEAFMVVEDGQKLSLGDKTLQFILTPWVHWPETMCTYLAEDKILFSCDFFGAHRAASALFVDDEATVYEAAKRYFAEIMMPFRGPIKNNLKKLAALEIEMIAPSHGQVYNRPAFILDAYRDWVGDGVKNEVVLAYVSMHDSTKRMVEHFIGALMDRGITVLPFNLRDADSGQLAIALVDAATIVIGSPTVLTGPHPKAAYAAMLANVLRPKAKLAGIIGSYGWAGKMPEQLTAILSNLKVSLLEPVLARGYPKDTDFAALDRLADRIAAGHKELGILH